MTSYEAPAKLNLSLHVSHPRADGLHPISSMVQTIDWLDLLGLDEGEGSDDLVVTGLEVEVEENLVMRAIQAVRQHGEVRPLRLSLEKTIPIGAGLGGGSSDAAAAILAAVDRAGLEATVAEQVAPSVGADVSLFLTGGTLMMSGAGESIETKPDLSGVAFAVVVPDFAFGTADVYRRWDEMDGPEGNAVPDSRLPPALRGGMPMRNDLTPAAVDLEPRLGDFIADVRAMWGTAVCLTGSGSACFGYFATMEEAEDAARSVVGISSVARGVALRTRGVARR